MMAAFGAKASQEVGAGGAERGRGPCEDRDASGT